MTTAAPFYARRTMSVFGLDLAGKRFWCRWVSESRPGWRLVTLTPAGPRITDCVVDDFGSLVETAS